MFTRIKLEGFKRFEDFSVACQKHNILVGPNNAGKSTVLDALRLVSDVLRYSKRKRPENASQGSDGVCASYSVPHGLLSVPIESINRNYQDDPARLVVRHENGNELIMTLSPDQPAVAYLRGPSKAPETPKAFQAAFPVELVIVPTLGPFEAEERYVQDETVRANENTRLAHRTFRNIILRQEQGQFDELNALLKLTWPNMNLQRPQVIHGARPMTSMLFEEGRIPREIHWAGFGFQVWLQMLLQVLRGRPNAVLVLDEPDIYLHADLQKKLLKLVRARFGQTFIATHSSEIINEADPGDILSIDSNLRSARRVTSEGAYRQLFKYIGSSENAEFARVARAKRIVFFEGKDRRLLRRISDKVRGGSFLADTDTVFLQAGGFGQWRRIIETNWTLENLFGMDVSIAALFDRDYRPTEEIEKFLEDTNSSRICCRVLNRKEIENYFLSPAAIESAILKRVRSRGGEVTQEEARHIVMSVSEEFRIDVQSNLMSAAIAFKRRMKSRDRWKYCR